MDIFVFFHIIYIYTYIYIYVCICIYIYMYSGCYAATQLALELQQERTQVVCSNKEARKHLARRHSRNGPWTHECYFEVDVFVC